MEKHDWMTNCRIAENERRKIELISLFVGQNEHLNETHRLYRKYLEDRKRRAEDKSHANIVEFKDDAPLGILKHSEQPEAASDSANQQPVTSSMSAQPAPSNLQITTDLQSKRSDSSKSTPNNHNESTPTEHVGVSNNGATTAGLVPPSPSISLKCPMLPRPFLHNGGVPMPFSHVPFYFNGGTATGGLYGVPDIMPPINFSMPDPSTFKFPSDAAIQQQQHQLPYANQMHGKMNAMGFGGGMPGAQLPQSQFHPSFFQPGCFQNGGAVMPPGMGSVSILNQPAFLQNNSQTLQGLNVVQQHNYQ